MTAGTRVFLALGSNIDPERHLAQALRGLAAMPRAALVAESSWYRTLPWGIAGQADFLNLVAEMRTGLSPRALLTSVQAIERGLGRVRTIKNGPRTLDIDILLYGNRIVAEPGLSIPHKGLLARDFMLIPLVEIAADLEYPGRRVAVKGLVGEIRYRQIVEIVHKRGGAGPIR